MSIAISDEILRYCEKHTSHDSSVCRALAKETRVRTRRSSMLTGQVEGTFLSLLARSTGARRVLEIGCFTGYSALKLAEGLPPDGRVITCDIDRKTTLIARRFWTKSPHGKKITLKLGPALKTIESLEGPFDLVFIDADKENYINYWEACVPKVRSGGLILVDNVLWDGRVIQADADDDNTVAIRAFNDMVKADDRVEAVILPIADGLTVCRKK